MTISRSGSRGAIPIDEALPIAKQIAVARDGRFLINQPVADAATAPITLLLNWKGGASAPQKR